MKIIVCLKVIADPDIVEFDIAKEELRNLYPILDPICHTVLAEGLALKEKWGGEVIAVSVASEEGNEILRHALLYGADRVFRLWHEGLKDSDTWAISQVIKQALERTGFDVVLCGARSRDTATGSMASAIAHHLKVASASGVIGIEVREDKSLMVQKKLPKGERETYSLALPAVLGVEEGLIEPGYVAPYSRVYRAGLGKEVEFLEPKLDDLKEQSLVKVVRYAQSRPRVKVGINISGLTMQEKLKMMRGELGRKKEVFAGPPEEAARKIYALFKEVIQ
jgi:electron transfer flavoprotein beta subunit